jgi:hypothetical protein
MESAGPSTRISVIEPIGWAFDRTGRMLFKPFDIRRWLTIGFCAWLAMLGEGGCQVNFNMPGRWGPGGPPGTFEEMLEQAVAWIVTNLFWIVPLVMAGLALSLVVLWVRARGKFMFLECVARDEAAVKGPWSRLREVANSYFGFQVLVLIAGFGGTAIVLAAGFAIALPDIEARRFGVWAIAAIVLASTLLLIGMLLFVLIQTIAEDFIIPLMYLRRQSIWPAWKEFASSILAGHAGPLVLFYLMRLALGLVTAMIVTVGTCATCCLAALPYVNAVVFLPVFVFHRSYTLYFLQQFGGDYNLIVERVEVYGFPVIMHPPPPVPPQQGPDQSSE